MVPVAQGLVRHERIAIDIGGTPSDTESARRNARARSKATPHGRKAERIRAAADGARAVAVTGSAEQLDSNYWRSGDLALEPSTVYALSFRARRLEGAGGCPTTGPIFCNRDVTGLTDEVRHRMGVADDSSSGVVVIDVLADSAAGRAGVQIGDVIERVAQTPIRDVATFQTRVQREKGSVKLRVRSRGEVVVRP